MRNLKIYILGVVFALMTPSCAFGGTRDPQTPDEQHLKFGEQFPHVVKIQVCTHVLDVVVGDKVMRLNAQDPAARVNHQGSAVIIAPHWIVTAAHVVKHTNTQTIEFNNELLPLQGVFVHPQYVAANHGYYDIALGYCPKYLQLTDYPALYTERDEVGKTADIAGFGWHGTFETGGVEFDGQRRAGRNKINGIEEDALICDALSAGRVPLEFLICGGDSGGGLFINNKLAGINSFLNVLKNRTKPGGVARDTAAFTRISVHAPWLREKMIAHERTLSTHGQ